jgi:uncharacterized protein YcbK (DUF882 family)
MTPQVFSKSVSAETGVRSLTIANLHTGDRVTSDYWIDGQYQPEALATIDFVLRDHRSDEVFTMDRNLLDLLHQVARELDSSKPVEIFSGYRAPQTNAMLRRKGGGVAKNSYHTKGMAVDIRLPGRSLGQVYKVARSKKAGGVAYYGRSGFVHVDVGPVRTWGARPRA